MFIIYYRSTCSFTVCCMVQVNVHNFPELPISFLLVFQFFGSFLFRILLFRVSVYANKHISHRSCLFLCHVYIIYILKSLVLHLSLQFALSFAHFSSYKDDFTLKQGSFYSPFQCIPYIPGLHEQKYSTPLQNFHNFDRVFLQSYFFR